MANEAKNKGKKKRQRAAGVPTLLVILLLIIALAMGGLGGFFIARRTAPVNDELEKANERIIELENTLNLIGFPMDEDPEDWVFDDNPEVSGADELSGKAASGASDDLSDLWDDDSLLTGTLDENTDPVVVAEFDGGQLLSTEVIPEFNDQLTTQIFAGYSASEVADSVLQTVLTYKAAEKLIALRAKAQGLDQLTDEDRKEINSEAQEIYDGQVEYYSAFVAEPEMTPAEVKSAAEAYMRDEEGITLESIVAELEADWPTQKFYEEIVKDVTVTDAEVEEYYREELAMQKETFTQYPEEFEYSHTDGDLILYRLDGYRAVRDLLIPFASDEDEIRAQELMDQISQLDPLSDAQRIQELEAELNPLFAPLEATAKEIQDKLQAGESFMALVDQYGSDEMMESEPVRSEGYYISDTSYLFSTEFIQGSMILERPGQVSSPLRSTSGLHLVEYLQDVVPGDVPLEEVRDAVEAKALEARQRAYYDEQTTAMLEEANVQYYPERLQ